MSHLPELIDLPQGHEVISAPEGYHPLGQAAVKAAEVETSHTLNAPTLSAYMKYLNQPGIAMNTRQERLVEVGEKFGLQLQTNKKPEGNNGALQDSAGKVSQIIADELEYGHTASAEKREELEEVKDFFRNLKPEMDRYVEEMVDHSEDFPPLFRAWRAESAAEKAEPEKQWTKWLAQDATDQQVLNFLQWHNARIARYNADPVIRAQIAERQQHFMQGIEKLRDEGFLSLENAKQKDTDLRSMRLYAADPIKLVADGKGGRTSSHELFTVLLPEALTDSRVLMLEHELAHFEIPPHPDDELWVEEVGADMIAGAVATGSTDPLTILKRVLQDPATEANDYNDALKTFVAVIGGDEGIFKSFLRYASASSGTYANEKMQRRAELNQKLKPILGQDDSLAFLNSAMSKFISHDHR